MIGSTRGGSVATLQEWSDLSKQGRNLERGRLSGVERVRLYEWALTQLKVS